MGEINANPLFRYLRPHVYRDEQYQYSEGWAYTTSGGVIYCNPKKKGSPREWEYILAHCLLHFGLGHFKFKANPRLWNIACDAYIAKLLSDFKIGTAPQDFVLPSLVQTEEKLYRNFLDEEPGLEMLGHGTAGNLPDMVFRQKTDSDNFKRQREQWEKEFASGISLSVTHAVSQAAGIVLDQNYDYQERSIASAAKRWFINSYTFLGSLASNFRIINDALLCARMDIHIAAVSPSCREIYINPAAGLNLEQCKFVMAHEFLHAALRHDTRAMGRDPYLWNVACDYVINGWLVEMDVGELPPGLLYDESLRDLSAEGIYDTIATDLRRARKLATLRGTGLGDILGPSSESFWKQGEGVTLDEFYRNSISQGLSYHTGLGRGLIPAGLIEEIQALAHPPIAWDVELAKWFDENFAPPEHHRSYSRMGRRQASSPDIPRPGIAVRNSDEHERTYGVLLDSSGSMDRLLLAKALGAIASYSVAREIFAVRVIFCDASAYDQGYLRPEDIAGRVKIRGRGGTVLQPGIDLLDKTDDFPGNAPLLIITDGGCDILKIARREHAFLIPQNASLPFVPKGKVFRVG